MKVSHFAHYLEEKGVGDPFSQAIWVIADQLGVSPSALFLEREQALSPKQEEECWEAIVRRGKREPPQYIRGEVSFLETTLWVNPSVLIPRQETELLADQVASALVGAKGVLWDICCGSGCLGIALKKRLPQLHVVLSDLSEEALALAEENACRNGVEVELRSGDLLAPFASEKADYIVCNPPYVTEAEWAFLEPEVREWEPYLALVGGVDGLAFYRRLAEELPAHTAPGGKIWFEIGATQGESVSALFKRKFWKNASLGMDLAGKARFFSLETE